MLQERGELRAQPKSTARRQRCPGGTPVAVGARGTARQATTAAHPATQARGQPGPPPRRGDARDLMGNPLLGPGATALWTSPGFRRAAPAAVSAFGTARALARFYACLARGGEIDGVRVLRSATVERGRAELRRGTEGLWGTPMAYGAGFELHTELGLFGPAQDAFGHAGAGGSRHAAWPSQRIGFSSTPNHLRADSPDPRPLTLLAALATAEHVDRLLRPKVLHRLPHHRG